MMAAEKPYEASRRLSVPAHAAWQILTSRAGARLWLDDASHTGIRVGASFPLRDSVPAQVCGIRGKESIELSFTSGRHAEIEFRDTGNACEQVHEHNQECDKKTCEIQIRDYGGDGLAIAELTASWSAVLAAAYFVIDRAKKNRRGRQAIVVIHGVGSQRPLSTVKSFTHALIGDAKRWSKPDQMSASYELRRYQLPRDRYRPRTDLYELYWADQIPGTRASQVLSWLRSITFRRPRTVDAALRPLAYLSWATLVAVVLAIAALAATIGDQGIRYLWDAATGLAQLALVTTGLSLAGAALAAFLTAHLGDAATYLNPAPRNVAVRQSIREHGVTLLRRLHEEGGYDRIAIVGHSLGSVIGYDIIRLYWSQVHRLHGESLTTSQPALADYLKLHTEGPADVDKYRAAQRSLWREYRGHALPWLITDLVTIGSPLTHAGTLLARSPADLDMLITDLELPTCPPHGAADDITLRDTYLAEGNIRTLQMLTQATPFAVTRWTNIYAPAVGIIFGDPIGGPLAPVFGVGIKDVPAMLSPRWRARTPLAHSSYWRCVQDRKTGKPTSAIIALREAVDLESGRWLDAYLAQLPWELSVTT
jgi:hypothetical protein